MRRNQRGFTLIEIMVVVVIISIMVGTVTLSFPDTNNDLLKEDAERFSSLVYLAQDEAILQSRDLAIAIDDKGYSFFSREDKKWQAFSTPPFTRRTISGLAKSALYLEGVSIKLKSADKTIPQIVIYSSGEVTPFTYSFGYEGKSSASIAVDGGGDVKKEIKLDQ